MATRKKRSRTARRDPVGPQCTSHSDCRENPELGRACFADQMRRMQEKRKEREADVHGIHRRRAERRGTWGSDDMTSRIRRALGLSGTKYHETPRP